MKRISSLLSICTFIVAFAQAQNTPKSPPISLETTIGQTEIAINYNSPYKKGRTLWGDLVPYDQVWRTGANSATKISLSSDVKVEGETLKAGTYSIFTIPTKEKWTVIFNTVSDQWGAYSYDKGKDALRVVVSPTKAETDVESMTFEVSGNTLMLKWGKLVVPVSIEA